MDRIGHCLPNNNAGLPQAAIRVDDQSMKRIAIVTGASAGLGREFALQIDESEKPDEIWLVARRRDRLAELSGQLKHASGIIIEADLATTAGCALVSDRLAAEPVELAVFVNNAGFGTYGPFIETGKEWQLSMIDLNIRALTDLSWTALRHLKAGGLLINVASLAAFMPLANFAVYAATKAYVLSFSTAIAAESEHRGVRVIALCPGSTSTEFALVASGGARSEVLHGLSAAAVVRGCLRHARRGKWQSLPAINWKITAFASRWIGRRLVARLTWRFAKRPQAATVPLGNSP